MKITIKEADLLTLKDGTEFKVKGDDNVCKLEIKNGKHQVTIGCEVLEVSEEFNYNDIEILNNEEFYHNLPGTFIYKPNLTLIKDMGMFQVINGDWTGTKHIENGEHLISNKMGKIRLDSKKEVELNIQILQDAFTLKSKTKRLLLNMDAKLSGVPF